MPQVDFANGHCHTAAIPKSAFNVFGLSPCLEDEFAWGIKDASYDAFPNRWQCQSQPMSDRVSFPLLAIVVNTHPGDQNSAPRIDDIVYTFQI
ncbi:hypothetical protein [Nostoc sp. LPT]|uniref:hypothetical protein n=1 Tax=Nostoc sp. LPT TaxID=2815387 RepID=UPI0025E09C61|nr:hypothetical protein [Nostoc sp. LPT]